MDFKKNLIFLMLFFLPLSAVGLESYPTLIVGLIDQDRPPYFWKAEKDTRPKGAYIDILERITEKTGIKFEYRFLPQARIRHYMLNEVIDVEPGIAKEWRMEPGEPEASVYTDIFYTSQEVIIYNPKRFKRNDLTPEFFSDLSPCSILGFNNLDLKEGEGHTYDKAKPLITEQQILKLIKVGRCDFAVFPLDVIGQELKPGELNKTKAVAHYDLRIRLTRKNKYLLPVINGVIEEMQKSGEIKKAISNNQE